MSPGLEVLHLGVLLFKLGFNRESPRFEIEGATYLSVKHGFWNDRVFKSDVGRSVKVVLGWGGSRIARFDGWTAVFKPKGRDALCVELRKPHALKFCLTMVSKNQLRLRIEGSGYAGLHGIEWSELLSIALLMLLGSRASGTLSDDQHTDRIYLDFEGAGFYPAPHFESPKP